MRDAMQDMMFVSFGIAIFCIREHVAQMDRIIRWIERNDNLKMANSIAYLIVDLSGIYPPKCVPCF